MYLVFLLGLVLAVVAKPHEDHHELFEGDIEVEGSLDLEISPTNAVRDPRRKWPNGKVFYQTSSTFSSSQKQQIESALRDINSKTGCVDFVQRQSEPNFINVIKGTGCTSFVGMTGRDQRLTLGDQCLKSGIIMHEFIHALGFHHEQTRPDRDEWVTINYGNIRPGYEHNFNKRPESAVTTLGTNYDYGSIMHDGPAQFSSNGSPTIVATKPGGDQMGQRNALSVKDIEMIQVHYGCKNARDTEYFQHLAEIPEFNMA